MKVSLKEARRIERRIQDKKLNNGFSLYANIDIYTNTILKDINAAKNNTVDTINNNIDLIEARTSIRRLIQLTNETSTINELIANREQYIRILGIWENVVAMETSIKNDANIQRNIKAKAARAVNGSDDYYSTSDDVQITAISEELYGNAIKEVRNTQAKIDNCDDKLSSLNANTTIDINTNIINILQKNNIL